MHGGFKKFMSFALTLLPVSALIFMAAGAEAAESVKVKITVGERSMTASFLNNATTEALVKKFPLTLPMADLYGREMCCRFEEELPAREAATGGYEVGDICYWTPRRSFVIFYRQNGEVISNLQKVGHIDSGVEIFELTGDVAVRFELADK